MFVCLKQSYHFNFYIKNEYECKRNYHPQITKTCPCNIQISSKLQKVNIFSRNQQFGFPTRPDTNQAVQESNDQDIVSNGDKRLCFRISRFLVFPRGGSTTLRSFLAFCRDASKFLKLNKLILQPTH